jgi:hypothetical protein
MSRTFAIFAVLCVLARNVYFSSDFSQGRKVPKIANISLDVRRIKLIPNCSRLGQQLPLPDTVLALQLLDAPHQQRNKSE